MKYIVGEDRGNQKKGLVSTGVATGSFLTNLYKEGEKEMAWNKPIIQEISVGLEINSYACAEQ